MNFLSRLFLKPVTQTHEAPVREEPVPAEPAHEVPSVCVSQLTDAEIQLMLEVLDDSGSFLRADEWLKKVREVIETAPVGTQLDRLRVVMKEKLIGDSTWGVPMFSYFIARQAHERARLMGPVTPDRELTSSELIARSAFLNPFAFDFIWHSIAPQVKQLLDAHNDPSTGDTP